MSDINNTASLGWCLVANVAGERGTKLFAKGAKLWLDTPQWGDGYERVHVVGRHRKSHRYIQTIVKRSHLENFRARQVYDPVIQRLIHDMWTPSAAEYMAASLNQTLDAHVELLHESGLFAPILRDPDDVAPRLVLADWLCERNDPRGPLINAACTDPPQWSPDFEAVQDRLGRVWLGSIADQVTITNWSRGFVDVVAWHRGLINKANASRLARATPLTELRIGALPSSLWDQASITADGLGELTSLRTIVIVGALDLHRAEEVARAQMPSLERIIATVPLEDDVRIALSSRKEWQP